MPHIKVLSAVDQVVVHLRSELFRGHWTGTMPGVLNLEENLGVNRKTLDAALCRLEHEGLLINQGAGRKRLIAAFAGKSAVRPLRVAILKFDHIEDRTYMMANLMHELQEEGHWVFYASKSLRDLNMNARKVAQFVGKTPADAWIVCAASRAVLEWFSSGPKPVFALFGHRGGLRMAAAGPDKPTAFAAATSRLLELGHERISLLCRKNRRLPEPGNSERAFLNEMSRHGIPTSDFNLPDWDETIQGFHALLNSLFQVTPPTALIIDETVLFNAVLQFLAKRSILVPDRVSLICTDPDPSFSMCVQSIAHINWDSRPLIRRIVRWAAAVGRGRDEFNQTLAPAEFIPGGTIGPVPQN